MKVYQEGYRYTDYKLNEKYYLSCCDNRWVYIELKNLKNIQK